jgi:hypothetical protein
MFERATTVPGGGSKIEDRGSKMEDRGLPAGFRSSSILDYRFSILEVEALLPGW